MRMDFSSNWRKQRYISRETASKATSAMVAIRKKLLQFGILVLSPGNNVLKHFKSKYDEYLHIFL